MKKLLLCIALCFLQPVVSQEISIASSQSEVFKDKNKHSALEFSESDDNGGFVTVRTIFGGIIRSPKEYIVEHYSKDLKLLKETTIEIDKNTIMGINIYDGKVFLLETEIDKKSNLYKFNVLEAPLSSLSFQSRILFSFDESDVKKYFSVGIGFFFVNNGLNQKDASHLGEVTFSKNKNFFCINFDIKDKDSQTQRLYVYDKNFNPVFEKEFKKDIKDRLFDYENIDVDDVTGEIYLLGKVFENNSRKTKKGKESNYHYELYKISANEQKSVSFKTGDNFVGSLFVLRDHDKISCAGFYSEKNDRRYKGVTRFDINPGTLQIENSSFEPFTEEFIIDKYGKSKDKELRNLSFRSGFLAHNGDIIINAEEFFIRHHTTMGPNGVMNTYTNYHYNDIVSVKINGDGKLVWARNINKQQTTAGAGMGYLSFSSTVVDDDTYLFINCSDKIRKLRNDRIEFRQARTKKSNLFAIKIDQDGNYTFKSIVDEKDSKVPFFVRQGISTSLNGKEMVFLGRKNSKKQFLKLNIL
ncbi:MAG: hypothetical protein WD554_06625 [Flavobacteriaceae bacterium]